MSEMSSVTLRVTVTEVAGAVGAQPGRLFVVSFHSLGPVASAMLEIPNESKETTNGTATQLATRGMWFHPVSHKRQAAYPDSPAGVERDYFLVLPNSASRFFKHEARIGLYRGSTPWNTQPLA
jgi:hypothetical protein